MATAKSSVAPAKSKPRAAEGAAKTAKSVKTTQPAIHKGKAQVQSDNIPGAELLNRIRQKQLALDLSLDDLASELGMSKSYLMSFYTGQSKVSNADDKYLTGMGKFLGIPKAMVYNLAEILAPEDFFEPHTQDQELERVFLAMTNDPEWAQFAMPIREWKGLPKRARIAIAVLYERVTHQAFLTKMTLKKFS